MAMTFEQRRMECLKLANVLATAKVIPPHCVLTTAREYLAYIEGEPQELASKQDAEKLRDRYARA